MLGEGGYEPALHRVASEDALRAALRAQRFDVVVSDYALPGLDGLEALRVVRELAGPDLPFVFVSGTIGGERAVEALKSGASDFVARQSLERLAPVVERELRDAAARRDRRLTLQALREAVAARDQFLSIASHELRTPITSLQLQVQSLQRALYAGSGDPDRVATKLKTVVRSTERLGELIDRLLDVSRITDGRVLELVREEFDLVELVDDVVRRYRELLRDSATHVELFAPAAVRGRWDEARIDTIVVNLVSNAVKYGAGKPVEVRVEREGDIARVSVRDHGIGIAPSDQVRIFERFERAVPERHYGGFGIGLWVARLVAEAHGGRLAVESKEGDGSTFVLELPLGEGRVA
jgi:signal transduction histidine kinase